MRNERKPLKTDKIENLKKKFPFGCKIYDPINPDDAGDVYQIVNDSDVSENLNELHKIYSSFFKRLPWKIEYYDIIKSGLGKTRFDFYIEEFNSFKQKYKDFNDQPDDENIILTCPIRCILYYLHCPHKIGKRLKKLELMKNQISKTSQIPKTSSYLHKLLPEIKGVEGEEFIKFIQNNKEYDIAKCKFFIRGDCKYGGNCRFIHDKEQSSVIPSNKYDIYPHDFYKGRNKYYSSDPDYSAYDSDSYDSDYSSSY